jgi:hypothetical protein
MRATNRLSAGSQGRLSAFGGAHVRKRESAPQVEGVAEVAGGGG